MRYSFLIVAMVMITGCSADNEASQTGFSFGSIVDIICSSAEFDREQYGRYFKDLPVGKRSEIERRMHEEQVRCAALKPIYESLKGSHKGLRSGHFVPRTRYLFQFSVSVSDIRTVGFFTSQKECDTAREAVESAGFSADECYKRTLFWKVAWV